MNRTAQLLMLLALLLGVRGAIADTIAYDTITGNVVSGDGDWFGYNPATCCLGTYVVGDQFTPTATGSISSLEAAMYFAGTGGPVALGVYSDNQGSIGTLLETLTVTASGNFNYADLGPYASGSYTGGVRLNAGQPYWIVTPDVSSLAYWEMMATPGTLTAVTQQGATYANFVPGTVGSLTGGTAEFVAAGTAGALGLEVTMDSPSTVPLPTAGWLLLSGLCGLGGFARWWRRTA